jgi:hypothetical protein
LKSSNQIAHVKAINAEYQENDLSIVSVYNERQALGNSYENMKAENGKMAPEANEKR